MTDFIEDVVVPLMVIVLGMVLFLIPIVMFANMATSYECERYSQITGRDTKMGAGTCYIKEQGQWYRWDEYKLRFATKGE